MNIWSELVQKVTVNNITSASDVGHKLATLLYAHGIETKTTVYNRMAYGFLKSGKKIEDFVGMFKGQDCYKMAEDCSNDLWVGMSKDLTFVLEICNTRAEPDKYTFELYTTSEDLKNKFVKMGEDFFEEKTDNAVHMLVHTSCGYSFTKIGELNCPLLRENYEDNVIKAFDYITKHMISSNPPGKLTILSGPAGTGKTYFIKGLINEISKYGMCVMLPTQIISELDGPSLIPVLLEHKYSGQWDFDDDCDSSDECKSKKNKPIIFIAEDADMFLLPRDGTGVSLISGLLNQTDGIMSDLLNMRFIVTTNASHVKIDDALKRPGRLLKHCLVDILSTEKANEVYERLTENKGTEYFNEPTSLAAVYARAYGADIYNEQESEKPEKRLGFNV